MATNFDQHTPSPNVDLDEFRFSAAQARALANKLMEQIKNPQFAYADEQMRGSGRQMTFYDAWLENFAQEYRSEYVANLGNPVIPTQEKLADRYFKIDPLDTMVENISTALGNTIDQKGQASYEDLEIIVRRQTLLATNSINNRAKLAGKDVVAGVAALNTTQTQLRSGGVDIEGPAQSDAPAGVDPTLWASVGNTAMDMELSSSSLRVDNEAGAYYKNGLSTQLELVSAAKPVPVAQFARDIVEKYDQRSKANYTAIENGVNSTYQAINTTENRLLSAFGTPAFESSYEVMAKNNLGQDLVASIVRTASFEIEVSPLPENTSAPAALGARFTRQAVIDGLRNMEANVPSPQENAIGKLTDWVQANLSNIRDDVSKRAEYLASQDEVFRVINNEEKAYGFDQWANSIKDEDLRIALKETLAEYQRKNAMDVEFESEIAPSRKTRLNMDSFNESLPTQEQKVTSKLKY